jgi:tRNA A-37 threonylcarbamoyl transferase component Bud32/tetratricopeptide (TPR) repeat protein
MSFAIGENVGPYRILEQLGQGGMATVFKAYHAALDRFVAIKVLHPAFLADPNFQARFQREAKVVARLDHPSIVPIYDFADHGGRPYLVMKFIEGETLKARLARAPLARGEGLRIVESAGGALAYAHTRGVLHRDIKPSNILLAPDGAIYLADFGLARMAQAGESTLSNDMMLGTPQYISPEQARGERNLDAGTDIYSFGVVLYEMVVGRVPFSADTPFSIIHDHIYKPLPLPRRINPRVPEGVERVLLKALAKERADRFASVDDMVTMFRSAVQGNTLDSLASSTETLVALPTSAEAATLPPGVEAVASPSNESSGTSVRKRRTWMWVAGGLAAACLCVFGFLAVASPNGGDGGQLPTEPAPAASGVAQVDDSLPVLEARQGVSQNPADPFAHLKLAEALRDQNAPRLALEEYLQAAELFLAAGDSLDAANTAVQAVDLTGGPDKAPAQVLEIATQALFLAASGEAAIPLLDDLSARYPGWALLPVLAGRTATSIGDPDKARTWLDMALSSDPEDPLANAAMAEWEIKWGDRAKGIRIAEVLTGRPRLQPWLADFLAKLLDATS